MNNRYETNGDITTIYVFKKGKYITTTINTVSFELANSIEGSWGYSTDGSGRVYIRRRYNSRKSVQLHRLITDCPDHLVVDHKDGNTLNNELWNLKVCTQTENMYNMKNNTSGIPCVSWNKGNKKWQAKVSISNKKYYLGSFDCKYEASREVTRLKIYHGVPVIRTPIKLVAV